MNTMYILYISLEFIIRKQRHACKQKCIINSAHHHTYDASTTIVVKPDAGATPVTPSSLAGSASGIGGSLCHS